MKDQAAFSISGALWVLDSQVVPMDNEGAQINTLQGKDGNQHCPWEHTKKTESWTNEEIPAIIMQV